MYKFCFASVRSLATLIRAAIGERSTGISKPRRKSIEPIVGWLAAQRADPISVTFFGYCAARGRNSRPNYFFHSASSAFDNTARTSSRRCDLMAVSPPTANGIWISGCTTRLVMKKIDSNRFASPNRRYSFRFGIIFDSVQSGYCYRVLANTDSKLSLRTTFSSLICLKNIEYAATVTLQTLSRA